ncbi:MAG: sensor histidine kinase [Actinobacteria bacterium]|nr:sensor histidine kinase [Actinomycetota bacterium]
MESRERGQARKQTAGEDADRALDIYSRIIGCLLSLGKDARKMDNAIYYSPEGAPVEVVLGKSGEEALVSVLDRGPGVAEGERERIFERFYRARAMRGHGSAGLGLGLFFAREVVEAHGGAIWCEPREGGGSAFRFTLP